MSILTLAPHFYAHTYRKMLCTRCSFKSKLLIQLVTTAKKDEKESVGKFPDLKENLTFFQNSFNPTQAKKEGVIIPSAGVNEAYDQAVKDVNTTQSELEEYLQRQRKRLGCKVRYLLRVATVL